MCALKDFDVNTASYLLLVPAACIFLLFSFLEKRKNRQDLCCGRPALIIPFHFLDGFENRVAYALAFGTATGTVVSLVTSENEFQMPLWAKALYVYFQAMIGCLSCFPLFACLTTRYRAVGAVLCILYSLLCLSLSVIETVQTSHLTSFNNWANQGNSTVMLDINQTFLILSVVPNLAYYLLLIVHCCKILYQCYRAQIYFHKHADSTVKVHQEDHVRWVFHKFTFPYPSKNQASHSQPSHTPSRSFIDQMKASIKLQYFTNFPFFKYPARMVALCFVQLNILYWVVIVLILQTAAIIYEIAHWKILRELEEQFQQDMVIMISVSLSIALVGSILNALAQIFVGARNYRYDMLRIYQGHRSSSPVSDKTPQNILTRNMTFPGYQVAFMLWGMVLCFVTVFLLIFPPTVAVYLAAKVDLLRDLLSSLAQLLSFPATVLVMFYLTVFMTKRVLLQEKVNITDQEAPLNVDNRKFYEIVSYYSLFTNMAVGVFACLFRIIQSAFFGLFFIGRLDRSVFPQELESWDKGYAAYTSMLLVDNAHNNPSMRVFAHLLWTKTLAARLRKVQIFSETGDSTPLITKPGFEVSKLSSYIIPSQLLLIIHWFQFIQWTPSVVHKFLICSKLSKLVYTLFIPISIEDVCLLETRTIGVLCCYYSQKQNKIPVYGKSVSVDSVNSDSSDNLKLYFGDNDTRRNMSSPASKHWHLALTLINNPQLCKLRKHALRKYVDL